MNKKVHIMTSHLMSVDGESCEINGKEFYITETRCFQVCSLRPRCQYAVTEPFTGLAVSHGGTEAEAKANAEDILKIVGDEEVEKTICEHLTKMEEADAR